LAKGVQPEVVSCPRCGGRGVVDNPKAQGAKMRKVRDEAGVTLREVAAFMKLSVGYLSDMEHGRKAWSVRKINFYLAAVETATQEREGAVPAPCIKP
jgi:predicted transcriptional regulator